MLSTNMRSTSASTFHAFIESERNGKRSVGLRELGALPTLCGLVAARELGVFSSCGHGC